MPIDIFILKLINIIESPFIWLIGFFVEKNISNSTVLFLYLFCMSICVYLAHKNKVKLAFIQFFNFWFVTFFLVVYLPDSLSSPSDVAGLQYLLNIFTWLFWVIVTSLVVLFTHGIIIWLEYRFKVGWKKD